MYIVIGAVYYAVHFIAYRLTSDNFLVNFYKCSAFFNRDSNFNWQVLGRRLVIILLI